MPNFGFTIRHLASFSLGFHGLKGHLYLNPRASAPLSVVPPVSYRWLPGATLGWPTGTLDNPVCPENEICAAPIRICRHIRAVLLDLFYHCRNVL